MTTTLPIHPIERRARRAVLGAAALLALLCALPSSPGSQTLSVSATSPHGRLMALVPESAGGWKRSVLRGPRADPNFTPPPGAEAEFRRGDLVLRVNLSEAPQAPPPPPSPPIETDGDAGTERIYGEGGATVRETVRRADGRLDLVLMRPDRVVVAVQGYRTTMAELRTVALAVRPLAR